MPGVHTYLRMGRDVLKYFWNTKIAQISIKIRRRNKYCTFYKISKIEHCKFINLVIILNCCCQRPEKHLILSNVCTQKKILLGASFFYFFNLIANDSKTQPFRCTFKCPCFASFSHVFLVQIISLLSNVRIIHFKQF